MKRSSGLAALALCAIWASGAARAATTTVTFDDLTLGTEITTQYVAQGVTFGAGQFDVRNDTFGIVSVPSSPNYARIIGDRAHPLAIWFNVPGQAAARATVTSVSWSNLGLAPSSGFFGGYKADAYDVNNHLIATTTVPPTQVGTGRSIFQTTLSGGDIYYLALTVTDANAGPGLTGIDDFTFPTPVAVPEPSMAVWGVGAVVMATLRRRAHRRD